MTMCIHWHIIMQIIASLPDIGPNVGWFGNSSKGSEDFNMSNQANVSCATICSTDSTTNN